MSGNTLGNAARTLAFVCDSASTEDGVGFSKFDADFGHRLAATPEDRWSPKMKWAAWKMLRKYRKQLAAHGIAFDQIPEPPDPQFMTPEPPKPSVAAAPQKKKAIRLDGEHFVVEFPYDQALVLIVKNFQNRRFDGTKKHWTVPADLQGTADVARLVTEHGFEMDDGARAHIEELVAEVKAAQERKALLLEASKAPEAEAEVEGLGGTLRPYQNACIVYGRHARRTVRGRQKLGLLVADAVGLGKTMEGLALVQDNLAYPALFDVPAAVVINWYRQLRKWLPHKRIQILDGRRPYNYDADIFLTNYEYLQPTQEYLDSKKRASSKKSVPKRRRAVNHVAALKERGLNSIVVDEIHNIKNKKTQRAQALFELKEACDPDVLVGLSGTPLLNRTQEMVSQLEFIGVIDEIFGGSWKFMQRYCGLENNGFGWQAKGNERLEELNQIMRSHCYIRRLRKDVEKDLPAELEPILVPLDIDNREEYRKAEADVVDWIGGKAARDRAFLDSIAHLLDGTDEGLAQYESAIAQHRNSAEEHAERAEHLVRMTALKKLAAYGKLAQAKEWIAEFIEGGDSLCVFSWHTEIVKAVGNLLHCPMIMGDTSKAARQMAIDAFSMRQVPALSLNIQAGGTGIDGLQYGGKDCAFLEFPWVPGVIDQAKGRLERSGQTESVQAYFLVAADTIDEDNLAMLAGKRKDVHTATEGEALEDIPEQSMLEELSRRLVARVGRSENAGALQSAMALV